MESNESKGSKWDKVLENVDENTFEVFQLVTGIIRQRWPELKGIEIKQIKEGLQIALDIVEEVEQRYVSQ